MKQYPLVRMVYRAHRIAANPYTRTGLSFEEAVIYKDNVRHELGNLIPPARKAVLLMAEGYSMHRASRVSGISSRSLRRVLDGAA